MEGLRSAAINGSGGNLTGFMPADENTIFKVLTGFSCVIMLIGIPGNLLVIASVIINKELRSAPNFLVLSLSICDLLFVSIPVPVHTYTYSTGHPPAPKTCWAIGFITNWLLASSVLSTGAIAINRYIAIVLKSKYHQISDQRAVAVICICVFLVPFLILSPTLFDDSLGNFGFESWDRNCGWAGNGILRLVIIGVVSIFPVVFMTLCYIRIVLYVIASRKRVGVIGQATTSRAARNTETRMTLMLAMVYIVYLVTTLPSLLVNGIAQAGVFVPDWVHVISFTFVWMSSAANPVVYGLVNKKYRDAYKSVARKINSFTFKRTQSESLDMNTQ
ncbi:melatonin receptor type 1C-like [Liolophura sinensis]|uniref:melatonin receptor type 1C-like n=1 Tax=Liolophura sinensis TaxID=3198878 RepID=UPI003159468F